MVLVLGMREMQGFLEQWQLDAGDLRRRMYWAPTPRERERWHARWLLVQGWTAVAVAVAEALGRDAHTIGRWVAVFGAGGPGAMAFEQSGGFPPAIDGVQQTELKAVVQEFPAKVGLDLANWTLRQAQEEGGAQICAGTFRGLPEPQQLPELPPSTRGHALHRLGFVLKRPKKRLLKADAAQRETFVAEYAALVDEAQQVGAQVFFVDEAHFRADADLRGKWVLKGAPALVDSTSPRWGEKASYYSAVCLETGEVEWMELEGNSNSATSAAFLRQLREQHAGPLTVIWDNSPAHRGDALRAYLATPGLRLRLVNLPGYSPDFNADEAIWNWVRQEVTANLCLGAKSAVQEKVNNFFTQLAGRQPEVKQRCRTVLQTRAEGLLGKAHADPRRPTNVDPTLVSV